MYKSLIFKLLCMTTISYRINVDSSLGMNGRLEYLNGFLIFRKLFRMAKNNPE